MKQIKFSEDYEKLPLVWVGTQATLIAVYQISVEELKNRYTAFWKFDTKIRGENRNYPLNFEHAIILVFIHLNTGKLFPTIRNDIKGKFQYYFDSIGQTFTMNEWKGAK